MLSGRDDAVGGLPAELSRTEGTLDHGVWPLPEPRVLLVEDDEGDALLVEELVADGAPGIRLTRVSSIAEAYTYLADGLPDCVLLDLNLPDAHGLDALAAVHDYAEHVPVVVLTGLDQEQTGLAAVAAGAQDYLVKGRVEPELFGRAVRYAIQRKQVELAAAALRTSRMRAEENARLERGLLPTPLLRGERVIDVVSRYRPGRVRALLGGDFYDVVQHSDGAVHALIGDISGHGPDEAAIGVALRLAWRTLVLSGITGTRQLSLLEEVLLAERTGRRTFATVTTLVLDPARRTASVLRAGHHGMFVCDAEGVRMVEVPGGPALGFLPGQAHWPPQELSMPVGVGLLLFTDGLFEGHIGAGQERLGEQGLLRLAGELRGHGPSEFVDLLIERAETLAADHGGLADDVAVMFLRWHVDAATEDGAR
ncbi:PP2C family protein-serine/threonine phosphatase [Nocardia bovistercoris]|uniref:Fused response regulator/phosphatase n=1 Tax=Nocardia bovistercoris TaxID=2785916 RepID=A0A931IGN0_9NOCA|nr:fused response regulator/phosphatase [Nocardia bovistercoris]MBH0781392.1 fused response regulator/phosphatase [Nocardia bovistercoris]